ncbi:hypothetical protein BH23ACT9_BH23ACT9_36680 [soil metagenome]
MDGQALAALTGRGIGRLAELVRGAAEVLADLSVIPLADHLGNAGGSQ